MMRVDMKIGRWFVCGILLIACASVWLAKKTQSTGTLLPRSQAKLGDLDGDGDTDALFSMAGNSSTLWINQGGLQGNTQGKYIASLQRLGNPDSILAALGDLDGDLDIDVMVGVNGGFEIYVNSGGPQGGWKGSFELQSQVEISKTSEAPKQIELGDLDQDGDLDAIILTCCRDGGGFSVWINDGEGRFIRQGKFAENLILRQAVMGDLDGDGSLDIWIAPDSQAQVPANLVEPNLTDQIWINDGNGNFRDRGDRPGVSRAVALGDLDRDGDLDAGIVAENGLNIWFNDGTGQFKRRSEFADPSFAQAILLGDLDRDGDSDILTASADQGKVWLNDEQGGFELSAQRIALPGSSAVALGDLDGDGDLDLFCGYPESRYRIWWNDGFGRLGLSWR